MHVTHGGFVQEPPKGPSVPTSGALGPEGRAQLCSSAHL